jgi:hypothetical protein
MRPQAWKGLLAAAALLGFNASTTLANPTYDPAPLKYEKLGEVFTTDGKTKGKNVTINGSKLCLEEVVETNQVCTNLSDSQNLPNWQAGQECHPVPERHYWVGV